MVTKTTERYIECFRCGCHTLKVTVTKHKILKDRKEWWSILPISPFGYDREKEDEARKAKEALDYEDPDKFSVYVECVADCDSCGLSMIESDEDDE